MRPDAIPGGRSFRGPAGRPDRLRLLDPGPHRILIVDDDEAILDLMTRTLGAQSYRVDTARSCEQALPQILTIDYRGILLDLILPDANGLALFRQIRRLRPNFEARVIFVTGALDEERVRRFRKVAANPLLTKPFDLVDLTETVRAIVSAPWP